MRACLKSCKANIEGIVENRKLAGEIPPSFKVDVEPLNRGLRLIPRRTYIVTCPHGQEFTMRERRRRGPRVQGRAS